MKIINFPSMLGQRKKGVQNTCSYLKNIVNNEFYDVNCKNTVRHRNFHLINNLWNLYHANILFDHKINIGGDHSMAFATIADSLNRVPQNKLKVLWFDAHPDINTYNSSKTKNFHGMPLSYLTNLDYDDDLSFITNTLNFDNLLYIGIRSLDRYERKIIHKYKIKYINVNEINNYPEESLKIIKNFIGNNPTHLSFDVDVMDPSLIPSTGTAVENGLQLEETKFILDEIKRSNIINMDITELNLDIGSNIEKKISLQNFITLFDKYLEIKSDFSWFKDNK